MSALIAFLHTLTPAQNVGLTISACVTVTVIFIAAFLLWENRHDAYKVDHIPEEPRKRVVKGYPVVPWR